MSDANAEFACAYPNCDKSYTTRFNLNRHIECYHLRIKRFSCHLCAKSFVAKANLRDHIYIHANYKPFECPVCEKKFRQSSQLLLHKRRNADGLCALRIGKYDISLSTLLKNEEESGHLTSDEVDQVREEPTNHILLPLIRENTASMYSDDPKLPPYMLS